MVIRDLNEYRGERAASSPLVNTVDHAIGRFCSISTRDANSIARDGSLIYSVNVVRQGEKEPGLREVRFADGHWMLCDAEEIQPC